MTAKIQYVTLALAGVALIVAVIGCFTPTAEPEEPTVTALIVDKTYTYVTISVDADHNGTVEVWCKGQYAGYVSYTSGNHVYTKQMNDFIRAEPMTSLELRYR